MKLLKNLKVYIEKPTFFLHALHELHGDLSFFCCARQGMAVSQTPDSNVQFIFAMF